MGKLVIYTEKSNIEIILNTILICVDLLIMRINQFGKYMLYQRLSKCL